MICDNISVSPDGRLLFAGRDTLELAKKYGTPLYLMDEDRIRRNCRMYKDAMSRCFRQGSHAVFAGKAAAFSQIFRIMQQEAMGIDVVSAGEIYTAYHAGFDMGKALFNGNNKTDREIAYAMDCSVGYFVVDGMEELRVIAAEAARRHIRQKLLLRLTPGIDPHTYEAVATGKVDSKFGSAIETGQAEEITAFALAQSSIELAGFHCHVGSQVFAEDVFERSAAVMLEFMARIRAAYGYTAGILDLGGGYGVRYLPSDGELDIPRKIASVAETIRSHCARLKFPEPTVIMEPGRSIVADSGMTLYTVGAVKRVPGYRNYVSVDGGMTDNPRYALYGARHGCYIANRMGEEQDMRCSLVGRCCESGDIIQPDILVPSSVCRGDVAAVCTTGAYNYSMASNYNRIPRPPVVMLRGGEDYVAVRRETLEELCLNDE